MVCASDPMPIQKNSHRHRADSIRLGLRSDAREDLLLDEEAQLCNVTDAHRLSRCHYEDLLLMQLGNRVILYFKVNTKLINLCGTFLPKPFEGKPWVVASGQRDAVISRDVTIIAGKKYVVLKATMLQARAHHDAVAGAITLVQMKNNCSFEKRDSR